MQITIEECSIPQTRKDIEELLKLNGLSQLVRSWVTTKRALCVDSGDDKVTGGKRVYLTFEIDGKDAVIAFLTEDEALRMYPRSSEVVAPPYRAKNFEPVEGPADIAFRDATDKLLETEYDEVLGSFVTDIDRALASAIGLALGYGQARITHIDREFIEEFAPDEVDSYCSNCLSVMCERWNEEATAFEGWDFYIDFSRAPKMSRLEAA